MFQSPIRVWCGGHQSALKYAELPFNYACNSTPREINMVFAKPKNVAMSCNVTHTHTLSLDFKAEVLVFAAFLSHSCKQGVMQWAVSQGHTELVTHLADNLDVPVTSRDATGGGGISSAATIGHAAMLESLIYRKADIEEADDNGAKPIHWAAYHGHTAAVRVLLSSRASAVSPDARGHTPLDLAMAASHADVVRQLVHEASVAPHSAIRPKKSKEL
eukprot:6475006-Amphidinium_carterae.1